MFKEIFTRWPMTIYKVKFLPVYVVTKWVYDNRDVFDEPYFRETFTTIRLSEAHARDVVDLLNPKVTNTF